VKETEMARPSAEYPPRNDTSQAAKEHPRTHLAGEQVRDSCEWTRRILNHQEHQEHKGLKEVQSHFLRDTFVLLVIFVVRLFDSRQLA
jgi:hypothetical protein